MVVLLVAIDRYTHVLLLPLTLSLRPVLGKRTVRSSLPHTSTLGLSFSGRHLDKIGVRRGGCCFKSVKLTDTTLCVCRSSSVRLYSYSATYHIISSGCGGSGLFSCPALLIESTTILLSLVTRLAGWLAIRSRSLLGHSLYTQPHTDSHTQSRLHRSCSNMDWLARECIGTECNLVHSLLGSFVQFLLIVQKAKLCGSFTLCPHWQSILCCWAYCRATNGQRGEVR